MKRNLLLLSGFIVRFVAPVLVLLRENVLQIFTDPKVGFTMLFSTLLVILLVMLNKTMNRITADLTNASPLKYLYHQIKSLMVFGILIGLSIGIAVYLEQIWFVLFIVGVAWIVSEHIFFIYYKGAPKS